MQASRTHTHTHTLTRTKGSSVAFSESVATSEIRREHFWTLRWVAKRSTEPRQGRSGREVSRHVVACCFPVGAHSFTNWPLVSSVIHCSGTGLQAGNQLPEFGKLISLPRAFHFPSSCFSHHVSWKYKTLRGKDFFIIQVSSILGIKQAFISMGTSRCTRIQTTVGLYSVCGTNTKSIKMHL